MKRLGCILLTAGCLFGAPQSHAREYPGESAREFPKNPAQEVPGKPKQEFPRHPAQELPAAAGQEHPAVSVQESPADFAAKAHAAARELRMLPPEEFSLRWLREEVDPFQRARRKIRREMQNRAMAQESVIKSHRNMPKRDLNKEVGTWRMSIGNTSIDNWSPFQDRALDARTIRFPVPRDARADKRTDQMKALDRMRRQGK